VDWLTFIGSKGDDSAADMVFQDGYLYLTGTTALSTDSDDTFYVTGGVSGILEERHLILMRL